MRVRLVVEGDPALGVTVGGIPCPEDWSTWIEWPWPSMPGWRDRLRLADFVTDLECHPSPGVATGDPYVYVDRVVYAAEGPSIHGGIRLVST